MGCHPHGESTIADKAACVSHEKVLTGEFPQVLLIRRMHRFWGFARRRYDNLTCIRVIQTAVTVAEKLES